jgi:hypothetical protein
VYTIYQMIVQLSCPSFTDAGYGDGPYLTNGIDVGIYDKDGLSWPITQIGPVQGHTEWAMFASRYEIVPWSAAGMSGLKTMLLGIDLSQPDLRLVLDGDEEDCLVLTFNDDHTNLTAHLFGILGITNHVHEA